MPRDGARSGRHGFIGRLVLAGALTAGVLLLLVAVTLRMTADMVERNLDNEAEQAGEMVGDLVGASMGRMVAQVSAASEEAAVRAAAGTDEPDAGQLAALQEELRTLRVQNPEVSLAFFIDDAGTAVAIDEPKPELIGENFSFRDYFQGTMERNAPYISEAFISTEGTKVATVSIPVQGERRGPRPDGMIAVSWHAGAQLQQLVNRLAEETGVNTSVIDQRGHVVAAVGADPSVLDEIAGFRPVSEPAISHHVEDRQVTAMVPLAESGWTVRADVPTDVAWANYEQLRNTIIALAVALGLLVGGVLMVLLRTAAQREQARARVRASEARLTSVLQAASDAYLSIDRAGNVRDWNARAEELFGWTGDEIVGRRAVDLLLHEADRPASAAGIARRWNNEDGAESTTPTEITLRHKDGAAVPVEISVWRAGEGSEATLNVFARDNRSRKQHEEALASARDAAVAAAEAKGSFLARMSHELRTPLNGVLGMAQLLDTPELSETQRVRLATLRSSGQQLQELIGDVLDLSKLEAGIVTLEQAPIDLAEVASLAVANVAVPAAERGLDVSVDIDPRVPRRVVGDPHRVRQILDNLVSNAVKFTPEGSVQVGIAPASDGRSDMVTLSVTDTGIGIPKDMLDLIFTPFAQADTSTTRRYGGTGLGLPIVADLAAQMGGEVAVDSAPGVGSTFRVRLRLPATDEATGDHAGTAPAAEERHDGAHVLIVEDNFVNQEVAAGLLESLGHRVTRADDGAAALDLVRTERFDVVLMDCQMPVMSGFEATAHIRRSDGPERDVPIIALTASATTEERDRCIDAGMDDHVAKPVTRERLEEVVQQYATGRRPVTTS